ncbi:MAG: homoserine kinase, partial [Oscillospiraceae bacterium]|nr:homoserine kinase [Oscillospiraceae bacterium]
MIIRIPGSSANLGPGFDCFGIGWQVYNYIEFLPSDTLMISGCPEEFQNADNLAYASYLAVIKWAGIENEAVEIKFLDSNIPVSRGLGSSAALIVGGAVAANEMHSLKLSPQQLLELTTPIEGHPDNIAPSIFGGFTFSVMDGDKVISVPCPISDKLHFTALIPDFKLSTELARS